MKKYIQPTSKTINMMAEGTIATSKFGINQGAADSDALSNKKKDMWGHKDMWD